MATPAGHVQNRFENRGNVANQAGQQYIYGDVIHQAPCDDDSLLELLSPAAQAAFNASNNQLEALCLSDTRVDVLRQITTWAEGSHEKCIFWLNGMAGTGKSTIARTIARKYYELGHLGASFFFSRGSGDLSHAGKFFTSIAAQLASRSPALKKYICEAIKEHRDIAHQAFRDQWKLLVFRPLSMLVASGPPLLLVIVVDALDECEREVEVRAILRLLAEARCLGGIRLRVLVTSRPETPIRFGFGDIPRAEHQDFVLHNISQSVIERDLTVFLDHELALLRRNHGFTSDWPGEQTTALLVQKAGGLFIWAATACRFISEGRRFARGRLSLILQGDTSGMPTEKKLDEIYLTVLKNSISGNYFEHEKNELSEMFKQIVGSIAIVFETLSTNSLAKLLDTSKDEVDQTLHDLHSLLEVPHSPENPIRLLHPSFRDFLLDKQRCRDQHFWVDERKAHEALAESSLRLMFNSLRRDICGLNAPGALGSAVGSSRIEQCLPAHLQYACCYWVQHLQRSESRLCDNDQVHKFLQKHFLHWLEALSLIGKTSDSIYMVATLQSMVWDKSSHLHDLIHDAKRFVLYNRSIIEEAPLQLYSAAIVFAPKASIIRGLFIEQVHQWIYHIPDVPKDWSGALQTLEGHLGWVNSVAFSPDGQLVASASDDRTVRLWDAATGAARGTLEGHSAWVRAVVFSPDGQLVASGSNDWTVRLWDTVTRAARKTLEGHSGLVTAVAFSPDGGLLASASDDRTVRLWDAATEMTCSTLKGHLGAVRTVVFSPDGQLVASGSNDWTVRLWDAATGAAHGTLEGHSGSIRAVIFSPDSQLVASASADKTVRLWDTAMKAARSILEGHSGSVRTVAFSPDGQLIASASVDRTVRLWDAATGAARGTLQGHSDSVNTVTFSPDGQLIASASADSTVRLWNAITGAARGTLEGHSDWVNAVIFLPDGQLMASASMDRTVRLWDTATRVARGTLERHSDWIRAVVFSPDGQLVASASEDKTVRLWSATTGVARGTLEGHSSWVSSVVFSPDGQLLASASADSTVRLWDAVTGAARGTLEGHSGWISTVTFSPDGQLVASASDDRTVRLWEATTGTARGTLEGHSGWVSVVTFSPDSQLVASTSDDRTVRIWDASTGTVRGTLEGHSDWVRAVVFSPDGQLVASASEDSTVRLWDMATGAAWDTLEGHSGPVRAVAFSPGGQLVASASDDRTVRLWDATMGTACRTLNVDAALHELSFSSCGQYLETDRGVLNSYSPFSGAISSSSRLQTLFVSNSWVTKEMENVLWLPPDYRATCVAVWNDVLVLGHSSGCISFFKFK